MKLTLRNILIIIAVILLLIGSFKLAQYLGDKEQDRLRTEIRKEKLRNDTLVKISDGYYSKLVADTLTKKQLRERLDSLEIELDDPRYSQTITVTPKEVDKQIDSVVVVNDTTINIEDYYPSKEEPFLKYTANVNTKTGVGESNFKFEPINLSLGIGQKEDGTYELKTRVPDFITIDNIDVESLPLTRQKTDNFGFLFGAGYGQDLTTDEEFLNIQAGIRYKKTYFTLNGMTNNTINGTLTFEF